MKKLIFNDSRQIEVQSVTESNGILHVRLILTSAEALKALFQDTFATQKLTYFENQQQIAVYENYTMFKYVKEEIGGIWEVEIVQKEKDMGTRLGIVEEEVKELKESGTGGTPAAYASVFAMAKMSAENITEDEKALQVKELYDKWSGASVSYKTGKYLLYMEVLYKVLQDHTSQETWTPDNAPSLYTKVLTDPSGAVLPWEQPQSTNGYKNGDRVTHKNKTWESTADNNIWEPGAVGAPWKEVTV